MKLKIAVLILILLVLNCTSGKQNTNQYNHIIKHIKIYASHDEYCAWPAMIRAANNDLLVTFCLNEEHLGPNGIIYMTRSSDNGTTWQKPQLIFDTPIDDRHAGLTLLNDGKIITHCWSVQWTPQKYFDLPPKAYEKEMIDRWVDYVEQPEYKKAEKFQGQWSISSVDNGHTWSKTKPGKDSIHGGFQLKNGTMIVASYRLDEGHVGVYSKISQDLPWQLISNVYCPKPDSLRFGEPHILQMDSGRIIMMIRVATKPYNDLDPRCYLWGTYSDDSGHTWAKPFKTPLWGYPPHLLLLSDGRVLCTYGYRRPPFGQRACISDDGITWKKENEIILRDDAFNKDLGYPVSVELEPGKVLSVYYQPDPADGHQKMDPPDPKRSRPDILGTIWKVRQKKE